MADELIADSLNIDGSRLSGTELGYVDGVTPGTTTASKALIVDANKRLDTLGLGAAGTLLTQVRVYSSTLSPVAVAANTSAEQTFTVTGLATTDKVFVNKPTAQAGLGIVGVRVSATDTLAITFGNFTAGSITPTASEAYAVVAIRS